MTEAELNQVISAAQRQLLQEAAELESLCGRVVGVRDSIPSSPMETDPLVEVEDDSWDLQSQIRGEIEGVVEDQLRPAIESLRAAAKRK